MIDAEHLFIQRFYCRVNVGYDSSWNTCNLTVPVFSIRENKEPAPLYTLKIRIVGEMF